jgi:fructose-1-phosphate kinase PfkB-like protein
MNKGIKDDLHRHIKSCAAGTATAKTPGTQLCHRMDVEDILPKVQISNL